MLGDQRRQRVGIDAVLVARHDDQPRAGEAEALQRGEVGGVLDEHDVCGIEQHAGEQPERLLGAGRDDDLAGVGVEAARGEAVGEQRAQPGVALRRGVLQRACHGGRRERRREGLGDHLRRKQLGSGEAAGERDDLGALGQREDVAHGGGADIREPRGQGGQRFGHHRHDRGLRDLCETVVLPSRSWAAPPPARFLSLSALRRFGSANLPELFAWSAMRRGQG